MVLMKVKMLHISLGILKRYHFDFLHRALDHWFALIERCYLSYKIGALECIHEADNFSFQFYDPVILWFLIDYFFASMWGGFFFARILWLDSVVGKTTINFWQNNGRISTIYCAIQSFKTS